MNPAENSIINAPLPAVSVGVPSVREEENPWRTIATVFPIETLAYREGLIVVPVPSGAKVRPTRSPFRTGEARLDDAGIHFIGKGVKLYPWLSIVGGISYVFWMLSRLFIHSIITMSGLNRGMRIAVELLPVLWMLLYAGITFFCEYRRIALELSIPWTDVVELRVDPQMRWARLSYWSPATKPGKTPIMHMIPIRSSQPGGVGRFVEAVGQFIPGRVLEHSSAYVWTTSRRATAAVMVLLTVVGLGALMYMIAHH